MLDRLWILLTLMLTLICSVARAEVYVLGSSFSYDALPEVLDDQPQWHIDCAKPLQYIFDNPSSPCVPTSTIWTVALSQSSFDQVSFQPVEGPGITQQSDIDAIGYWMSLQPGAVGVIHPTWPRPADFESTFHDANADHSVTNYSREYYYDLVNKLHDANPGRRFVIDRANEMLDAIYHDIENGIGPLTDFGQMFRDDSGHSSFDYGRYLQHNALRQAFGQPSRADHPLLSIDAEVRVYLDAVIEAHQPSGQMYGILFGPGDSTGNGAEDLVWPPDNHTMRWIPRGSMSGVWAILSKMALPDLRIQRHSGGGHTTFNGRYPRVCRDGFWVGEACNDDDDCTVGTCRDSVSYWEDGLASLPWINTVVTSQGVNDCPRGISNWQTLDNLMATFEGILQDDRIVRIVWWKNMCYRNRIDVTGQQCARDQFESSCGNCNNTIDGDLIGTAFANEPIVFDDSVYEQFNQHPGWWFNPDQGTNRQCHANNFGQREAAYLLLEAVGYPLRDRRPRTPRLTLMQTKRNSITVKLDQASDPDGDPLMCVVWASCNEADPDDTHPDPSCGVLPHEPGDYDGADRLLQSVHGSTAGDPEADSWLARDDDPPGQDGMPDYWAVTGCDWFAEIRGLARSTNYKINAIAVPEIVPGSPTGILPSFVTTLTVDTRSGPPGAP